MSLLPCYCPIMAIELSVSGVGLLATDHQTLTMQGARLKKFLIHVFFALVTLPWAVHAIGLGDMVIRSYLNQPFDAEIALIDVGSTPLTGIKAQLASVAYYQQIGLERGLLIDQLQFDVINNKRGKPVVSIHSEERMTDPYLEIVVDLAWAKGQIYRAYTVMLDPPDYEIQTQTHRVHGVSQQGALSATVGQSTTYAESEQAGPSPETADTASARVATTYGPTLSHESIWEIAERYKLGDLSRQQVVLAIVGANPDAFTDGNLNGLKAGVTLTIPNHASIQQVPAALAKLEVAEHNEAWQAKQPIAHVLMPPYRNGSAATTAEPSHLPSSLPAAPTFPKPLSGPWAAFPSYLPKAKSALSPEIMSTTNTIYGGNSQQAKITAQMDIAKAAIESIRETNAELTAQLNQLRAENKRLHHKLAKRDKAIKALSLQIKQMKERHSVAGQASAFETADTWPVWQWVVLVVLAVLAGLGTYWWFWQRLGSGVPFPRRMTARKEDALPEAVPEPKPKPKPKPEPKLEPEEPVITDAKPTLPKEPTEAVSPMSAQEDVTRESVEAPREAKPKKAAKAKANVKETAPETLEISEPAIEPVKTAVPKPPQPTEDEHLLEFEPGLYPPESRDASTSAPTDDAPEPEETNQEVPQPLELTLEEPAPTAAETKEDKPAEPEPTKEPTPPKPIKNTRALDTLLDLAKTYLEMGDTEAAKQSLEEVMAHGSEAQKRKASELLGKLG